MLGQFGMGWVRYVIYPQLLGVAIPRDDMPEHFIYFPHSLFVVVSILFLLIVSVSLFHFILAVPIRMQALGATLTH